MNPDRELELLRKIEALVIERDALRFRVEDAETGLAHHDPAKTSRYWLAYSYQQIGDRK